MNLVEAPEAKWRCFVCNPEQLTNMEVCGPSEIGHCMNEAECLAALSRSCRERTR
jgi:hypothetical protein